MLTRLDWMEGHGRDTLSKMRNFTSSRDDVGEWLIHFVRDRDPLWDFPGEEDESERAIGKLIEADAPASSVLWSIMTIGALLPHWSNRKTAHCGSRSTIYGDSPVVCFTEAPLHDFAQYVKDRGQSDKCSPYGICVLKTDAFAAGARPVIYGLSGEGPPPVTNSSNGLRVIDEKVLPASEQYRYVAYDPNRPKPLDFTHEREWRWRPTAHSCDQVWYDGPDGCGDYPGLPLFRADTRFTRIGIVVPTREDAERFAKMILAYKDAAMDRYGASYSQRTLEGTFVVPLEDVLASKQRRLDDLSVEFRIVAQREKATVEVLGKVKSALEAAKKAGEAEAGTFIAANSLAADQDVPGSAWIETSISTTAVTDALITLGVVSTIAEVHRIRIRMDLLPIQALNYHESANEAAATVLTNALGQPFWKASLID